MEIKTVGDLVTLKNQIRDVNKDVQLRDPNYFWVVLESTKAKRAEELAAVNNRLYERLPNEINIDPDVAKAMLKEVVEYLEKRKKIDIKYPNPSIWDAMQIAFPLFRIGAGDLTGALGIQNAYSTAKKAFKNVDSWVAEVEASKRKLDISTIAILGAYNLVAKDDGTFTLEKAVWYVSKESFTPDGRGNTASLYITRPKNAGLDGIPKDCAPEAVQSYEMQASGYYGLKEPEAQRGK
jgi:hypothetical protein